MRLFTKIITSILLSVTALCVIFVVVYWSPDLSKQQLRQKYTNDKSQFFSTAAGEEVHYRDQGPKNAPVLVLIHGTSASLHTWEPLVDSMAQRYRMISFDLPGHGLTGEFKQRDYSRHVMIVTLFELLDELNIESATLVGNSLGGGIAWQAALAEPTRVNALVLLAPSGAKRTQPSQSNIGFQILSSKLGQTLMQKITPRFLIAKSLEQTVQDQRLVSEEMTDRYWELLKMQGNRQAMVDLVHSDRNEEAFTRLHQIKVPCLLVWGQNDQLLPVDMIRQFEESLNVSQSVILTNIGHLPQEEAVDTLATEINAFCGAYQC